MKKAIKVVSIAAVLVLAVMIATPRLWVKNKKAHFVQDGKVRTDMRLYFGAGDRMLLVPAEGDVAYVSGPPERRDAIAICAKSEFRMFKSIALGSTANCVSAEARNVRRGEVSWHFATVGGRQYEVSWETDFRR